MKTMNRKTLKTLNLASKICTEIFTFLFGIIMVGGVILFENVDAVNTVFKGVTQIEVKDPDADSKDSEYFKTSFNSVAEVKANGEVYAETVVAEGATLLKNERNALPLKKDATVSLFSTSSVDPIVTGTGSGGSSGSIITLKDGLEAAGVSVNADLWTWYKDNLGTYGKKKSGGTVGTQWTIGDASWSQINTPAKTSKADAAIFVLSRSGGEGIDSTIYGGDKNDFGDGNYLKLSPSEKDVLKNLKLQKEAGTFEHIIVLLNFSNQVQLDFEDEYGIDAVMWVGNFGEVGAYAIGDLLAGNVNPSGRLADTFWRKHYLNPVHANFATLIDTSNNASQWNMSENASVVRDIVYQEGVYMGYRYTETRYEDKVLGTEKTGEFDYNATVAYPFGYGISYTDFKYDDFKVVRNAASSLDKTEANYTITLKVTNTGSVAGKEVVQIYAQKPYTDYDKQYGIEKPSVELVGFTKTKTLSPGASETVTVEVNERELATYDSYNAKTYIIEDGTYYFTAAKDAHDAVNNVLAAKGKTTSDGMTADGNSDLVYSETKTFNDTVYSRSAVTGADITNRFDDVDLKLYDGAGNNKDRLEYITRSNWQGTVKFGLDAENNRLDTFFNVTCTDKMQADFSDNWNPVVEGNTAHGGQYPVYGSTATNYVLVNLRAFDDGTPIPYDNPLWDKLLDQLTFEDTVSLLTCGFRKTNPLQSIAKPETIDQNGGSGPVVSYNVASTVNRGYAVRTDDVDKGQKPVVYPCNALIASTFNLELADYYGRQWGEDMLWSGMSGLYGMGMNTHRSAYGGRNFEYYSEDPVLMGKIAAQTTKGMATRGAYVYLKHAFLNDQETARCGGFTWANEQSIREIYLKSFQIAIEEGGAQCVMGGLNSLGVKWTGTHGFMNTVLRGEFGMTGHVVTDSYGCYNGSYVRGVLYGNDIPDGTLNTSKENFDYVKDGKHADMAWAMREAAHRVLYTVVQSNAMNAITSGTRFITVTPAWVNVIKGFQVATGILFGLSVVAFGSTLYLLKRKPEGGEEE